MNANVNKINAGKFLVAILAMAIIVASAAMVLGASETKAEVPTDVTTEWDGIFTGTEYKLTEDVKLSKDVVIPEGYTLNLGTSTLYTNGYYLGVTGGTVIGITDTKTGEGGETTYSCGTIDQSTGTGPYSANNFYVVDGIVNIVNFTNFNTAISNNNNSGNGNDVLINNCTFEPSTECYSGIYIDMHGQQITIRNTDFGTLSTYTGKAINLAIYDEDDKTNIKIENCTNGVALNIWGPQTGSSSENQISFDDSEGADGTKNILDIDENTPVDSLNMSTVGSGGSAPTVSIDKPTEVGSTTGQGNLIVNEEYLSEISSDITVTMPGQLAIGDTINSNLTIDDYAYLTTNLRIPEGKTLTISSTATLNMYTFDITVEGELIIERNGVVTSTSTNNSITLTRTGSISNAGIIGDSKPVTISGQDPAGDSIGTIVMQGVSGANINLDRSGTNYYLTLSGDVSKINSVDVASLKVTDITIDEDLTINRNVTFTVSGDSSSPTIVAKGVAFTNNNGTVSIDADALLLLQNGASAVIEGRTTGAISSQNGYVGDNDKIYTNAGLTTQVSTYVTATFNGYESGVIISVDRVTVPNETNTGSDIIQRTYVSGTASFMVDRNNTDKTTSDIDFVGTFYVSGEFYIPEEISVTGTFDVSVGGTIIAEDDGANSDITYTGAKYIVESDTIGGTDTAYYTSFDNAMSAIGTASRGEILVNGAFDITQSYTIGADQVISVDTDSNITVEADSIITVDVDGSIASGVFLNIYGQVVVNDGGYRPDSNTSYAVMTNNTETGVVTYSGFKVALDNASSGDTINTVGEAYYEGNMTIPSGVTVNIGDNLGLQVTGNVTIENAGALNLGNTSRLVVGNLDRDSTITVNGTLDASDMGTISAYASGSTANVDLYSTGTVSVPSNTYIRNVDVNAAYYVDGDTVYTSVSNAAAYAAENGLSTQIHAMGTFSETADIVLDGVDLIIDNNSAVTLGNVSLDGANISSAVDSDDSGNTYVRGTYTATVTALSGTGDAAVNSTVSVNKSTSTIASSSTLDATGANVYELTIDTIAGNVTVMAGTVDYTGASFTASRTNSLTVQSGATLVISASSGSIGTTANTEGTGIDNRDYLVNEGTIEITGNISTDGNMILGGTIIIDDGGQFTVDASDVVSITGNLTISAEEDNEGTMYVSGTLEIGGTPEMLGIASTGTASGEIEINAATGLVVVYNGATVTDASIVYNGEDAPNTTYEVNSIELATVYGADGVSAVSTILGTTYIDSVVLGLINLETENLSIKWYSGESNITNAYIGDYDVLSTEIDYAGVDITVSQGPGISLYIDDIYVGNAIDGIVNLPIGEHTITAYIDAGYEGTPVITLNGETISGSFTITSEMLNGSNIIYATGASPIDYSQGGSSTSSDDGMGLTDYLLIILVVLIVIMAIMVAMRLMRS